MRTRFLSLAPLLLVLAGGVVSAQVTITGRIEPLGTPPVCAPAATHRIADTGVHLLSTTIDLSVVSTITQKFSGADVGSPGCPLIDVATIAPSSYSLFPCNTTALGCTFTLDQCPSPTQGNFLIGASVGSGYLPLGAAGTVLLNPGGIFPVTTGVQTAVCQSSPITLTLNASLIGASVHVQALNVGPLGDLELSNVTVVTIDPPGGCTGFVCY